MLTNADCTVYTHRDVGYDRHVVKDVYWLDNRGRTITKNGIQSSDSVTVYMYSDTAVPKNAGKDLLVKGISGFEFDNSTQQSVSESLKEFRKKHPDFVTVTAISDYRFGSLPHIEISAR